MLLDEDISTCRYTLLIDIMEEEHFQDIHKESEIVNFGKFNSIYHPIQFFYSQKQPKTVMALKEETMQDIDDTAVTRSSN